MSFICSLHKYILSPKSAIQAKAYIFWRSKFHANCICLSSDLRLGSGAVALAHLDGTGTDEAVSTMVTRVQELALGYPEGRIELQLIGGYKEMTVARGYAEDLFYNIMREYLFCDYFVLALVALLANSAWICYSINWATIFFITTLSFKWCDAWIEHFILSHSFHFIWYYYFCVIKQQAIDDEFNWPIYSVSSTMWCVSRSVYSLSVSQLNWMRSRRIHRHGRRDIIYSL